MCPVLADGFLSTVRGSPDRVSYMYKVKEWVVYYEFRERIRLGALVITKTCPHSAAREVRVTSLVTCYRTPSSVQLSPQSCPTLCNPINCSTPGFPVHHQFLELAQTHVHQVGDAIQPSHPLSSPSPDFNLSQHQSLFQWVSFSHQVEKVLEFQLQHQSFQWIFRTDFL